MGKKIISRNVLSRNVYIIITAIAVICIMLSILIQSEKSQYLSSQQTFCSIITGSGGCQTVQTSRYSSILGVSNPIYGIAGFALLAVLSGISIFKRYKTINHMIIAGSIIASSLAAYFLYLQTFVIHAYCIFCVIVDVSSFVLLGIVIYLLFICSSSKHK